VCFEPSTDNVIVALPKDVIVYDPVASPDIVITGLGKFVKLL
jgi:hypothetical protein